MHFGVKSLLAPGKLAAMKLDNTYSGTIQKRYKRFLADVTLKNGEKKTIYVPNTGSMKACWGEDWKMLACFIDDPKRKYAYTLEMTHNGDSWIGINTSRTNALVEEALQNKMIKELSQYDQIKREVKYGKSRLDFLLNDEYFLEVKNVTLKEGHEALFPDAVSTRGHKHLEELMEIVKSGKKAGLLFVVQREDVENFNAQNPIDPKYTKLLYQAKEQGVDILCYQCKLDENEIKIDRAMKIIYPGLQ